MTSWVVLISRSCEVSADSLAKHDNYRVVL